MHSDVLRPVSCLDDLLISPVILRCWHTSLISQICTVIYYYYFVYLLCEVLTIITHMVVSSPTQSLHFLTSYNAFAKATHTNTKVLKVVHGEIRSTRNAHLPFVYHGDNLPPTQLDPFHSRKMIYTKSLTKHALRSTTWTTPTRCV